jgi:hypothetical protein
MSNDDPTKRIDDVPATPPTQPTIETVLQRINELGEQLRVEIAKPNPEIAAPLKEIDSNIRLMNRKFDIVSKELLEVKAEVLSTQDRLDKLERKPS